TRPFLRRRVLMEEVIRKRSGARASRPLAKRKRARRPRSQEKSNAGGLAAPGVVRVQRSRGYIPRRMRSRFKRPTRVVVVAVVEVIIGIMAPSTMVVPPVVTTPLAPVVVGFGIGVGTVVPGI